MLTTRVYSSTLHKEVPIIGVIESEMHSPQQMPPTIGEHIVGAYAPTYTFVPPIHTLILAIEEAKGIVTGKQIGRAHV